MTSPARRIALARKHDPESAALVERLLALSGRILPQTYRDGGFVFTLNGVRETPGPAGSNGGWRLEAAGTSLRYGAITAIGLLRESEAAQRATLGGDTCHDLIGRLAKSLDDAADLGDVALLAWAAADAVHAELPHALARLAALDDGRSAVDVVAAAWVVSALVAARPLADVEPQLAAARRRLLAARGAVYPHTIPAGATSWYRAHVGCFADQVYPVQALARLHGSGDDPEALATANDVAAAICAAQGEAGQWWWHYDSRTGGVVEGYPVYTVHQHAMGPMALLDLADAGGDAHLDAICRGLRWLTGRPETGEVMILDEPPVTWRKVARDDPRKVVRGLRAAATRVHAAARVRPLDRAFPPGAVDHECRPYELGWLLLSWLS